ncbi:hypothetical protein VE00_09313 [Pseudogymnoascus sp. WSF 3629]|nr:hypothetical protein VE00_09313 [Pseudogymnoascus sp. WSF 3629]
MWPASKSSLGRPRLGLLDTGHDRVVCVFRLCVRPSRPRSTDLSTTTLPRQEPVRTPIDEIRCTLEDLDSQRIQGRARREPVRVSPDDVRRTSEVLECRNTRTPHRKHRVSVPEDELACTMTAITQEQAEERSRTRAARLRMQEQACEPRRQGPEETPPTLPLAIPETIDRLPQETAPLQRESLEAILRYHESRFRDKEKESAARSWCKEVPLALQVETAKSFYQAFTDETLQECTECFPAGDDAESIVCHECSAALEKGKLPKTCAVNNMHIGCEHRYPEALDGLSLVVERLIALQASFGYITKFTVDNKTPSGLSYRKHVKGHIAVFPNKVEDRVATVLPHPLLETIENIHVSWSGYSKPGAADVGHLLQVRKSRVRAALSWLQKNNPLYEHIAIDHGGIDGWQHADGSNVPILLMDSMQRDEPSAAEKTQTDHTVPDTDRGLEENRFTSIE